MLLAIRPSDMPCCYILFSNQLNRYYVGASRDVVDKRTYKHNHKHKGFTAAANDWCVVYVETFQEFKDALSREKQIKAWKSRIMIEKLINVSGHGSAHPDL